MYVAFPSVKRRRSANAAHAAQVLTLSEQNLVFQPAWLFSGLGGGIVGQFLRERNEVLGLGRQPWTLDSDPGQQRNETFHHRRVCSPEFHGRWPHQEYSLQLSQYPVQIERQSIEMSLPIFLQVKHI